MNKYQDWLKQGHILQIKDGKIFVAEKPAVVYHREQIFTPTVDALGEDFQEIQVMQSATKGVYAMSGKPTPSKGSYLWLRAKNKNGIWSDWLCRLEYVSFMSSTRLAAAEVAQSASILQSKARPYFREAVLKNIDKKNQLANIIEALQNNKQK